MNLTVVILARNEEQFIENAVLSALEPASQVIVLDSGSRDRTTTLAKESGATVHFRQFSGFASQRQAALELVDTEWTLFLDADERLTPKLSAEIQEEIGSAEESTGGFWIPRRNLAFGHILKGGGWWPDCQLRLLRTRHASYLDSEEVHEVAAVDGVTFSLNHPIVHINYLSRLEFIGRQWSYAKTGILVSRQSMPRRRGYASSPAREFWMRFVELRGYQDGLAGLFMAVVTAAASFRRVWLMRRHDTRDGAGR